jgi:hypothetical protein
MLNIPWECKHKNIHLYYGEILVQCGKTHILIPGKYCFKQIQNLGDTYFITEKPFSV